MYDGKRILVDYQNLLFPLEVLVCLSDVSMASFFVQTLLKIYLYLKTIGLTANFSTFSKYYL